MTGIEINMVVKDSLQALELYEKIFEVKRIEVTNLTQGQNEAVFTIYDMRIHVLDENPEFDLFAPTENQRNSMWFNVIVTDIQSTFNRAIELGCKEIQGIKEIAQFGVSNAIFIDPFGYVWLLHQIHKEVSFEERMKYWEENKE